MGVLLPCCSLKGRKIREVSPELHHARLGAEDGIKRMDGIKGNLAGGQSLPLALTEITNPCETALRTPP